MNLRQVAGAGLAGKLVGWLGHEDQGQSRTADWVLVLALGVENRRGLGTLAAGEDKEEDQGGPVPTGLGGLEEEEAGSS